MLQKFLFIGLGGSGGKTLRYLYEDLQLRLLAERWAGDMPAAWQFLHIDVPTMSDGTSPDLPEQLSRRSYVGLAPSNMTYRTLDGMIDAQGAEVVRAVAPWRPEASRVGVNPTIGAGQFRSVGRAITAAALPQVVARIRVAVQELTNVDRNEELAQLSQLLTGDDNVGSDLPPQVVLVSSIAGGSGAGSFLDVADVVRHLGSNWCEEAAAFLYLPDVFADVPDAAKGGVSANALASLSETLNAFWADGSLSGPDDQALLVKAGVTPQVRGRRGPRYPFLIGRSNGRVRFSSQNEVYRVTAKALASWMTNPIVQDEFRVAMQGNWNNQAVTRADNTGLKVPFGGQDSGLEVPFSSLGFGSVGLGRERFADYARERLAAVSLDHLLRAHITEDVANEVITAEQAVDDRSADVLPQFLQATGLREAGPVDNQVLDTMRGGDKDSARGEVLATLAGLIQQRITRPGEKDVPVPQLLQLIEAANHDVGTRAVGELFEADASRARTWVRDVQEQVVRETSMLLGREGARVTEGVLSGAIRQLRDVVVPELEHDRNQASAFADQNHQRVASKFVSVSGAIPVVSRPVRDAIAACQQTVHARAEARLHEMAADLVRDLVTSFLEPIRDALTASRNSLQVEDQGTPQHPSATRTWSRGAVPRRLLPAQNEHLLEDPSTYPEAFEDRVMATVGTTQRDGAIAAAIAEVIPGLVPGEEHPQPQIITVTLEWIPRVTALNLAAPQRARFTIALTAGRLLEHARAWVWAPETPIADFVDESLGRYLDPERTTPQEHSERLSRFKVGLQQARLSSGPLLEIDTAREVKVHGAPVEDHVTITPMPFRAGHPARDVVAGVFHDVPDHKLARMFSDEPVRTVEITSAMAGNYMPAAIRSFVEPITTDWNAKNGRPNQDGFWERRRARRLSEFIAMPPAKIRACLIGWHVARLLDWVDFSEAPQKPVRIWSPEGWLDFPHPLLGPPIGDMGAIVPRLLESFSLTLLCDPGEAMTPYWQLIALGAGDAPIEWYEGASVSQSALRRALVHGQTLTGAPDLLPALADCVGVEERIAYALDRLDRYRTNYAAEASAPFTRAADMPATWEIADLLEDATGRLADQVRAMHGVSTRSPDLV